MTSAVAPEISPNHQDERVEGGLSLWIALIYLALHLALFGLLWTGFGLLDLVLCLLMLQVRGFCVSAAYHRLLAHRSFQTTRWFQFLLAAVACTVLRGGPLFWVALHRRHHRVSDTDEDIYHHGDQFWWSYGGWILTGRHVNTDYRQVHDLARLPELRWLNRFWLVPSLVLILGVYLLLGWVGILTVYVTSTVILLHSMALIDVANHGFGWKRYRTGDESRNSFLVSLVTGGEGWHNNHHHFPVSAKFGFFWWECDGTWTGLRLLERFGLVWGLRTAPPAVVQRNRVDEPTEWKETPVYSPEAR